VLRCARCTHARTHARAGGDTCHGEQKDGDELPPIEVYRRGYYKQRNLDLLDFAVSKTNCQLAAVGTRIVAYQYATIRVVVVVVVVVVVQ
jgi:hypothetical protein